ncbi:hypothetical protein KBC79_04305 [Candidatus Woesebacteria bacterium]|nr:hypothetical protein [Candidatus Woesebacteria bacterium]
MKNSLHKSVVNTQRPRNWRRAGLFAGSIWFFPVGFGVFFGLMGNGLHWLPALFVWLLPAVMLMLLSGVNPNP